MLGSLCYSADMKKSLMILAALGVAPLYAAPQVSAPYLPATSAVSASLGVESSIASSLAVLPSDVEGFAALGHVPGFLGLSGMSLEEAGPIGQVESAAFGFGAGTSEIIQKAAPVYSAIALADTMGEMATAWADVAHGYATDVIGKQLKQHGQEEMDRVLAAVSSFRCAPIYCVVTVTEDGRPLVEQMYQEGLESIQEDPDFIKEEIGPWKGGSISLSADDIQEVLGDADELTALQKVKLTEALRKFTLHLLCRVQGRSLVMCICSDPAELRLPDSPAASVLATSKCDFLKTAAEPMAAAYISPSLSNHYREMSYSPLHSLNGFATGVFKTLGSNPVNGSPEPYQKAVEALATLATQLESPDVTKPTTVLLWSDQDIHLDIVTDAQGMRFIPKEKALIPATDKNVFFLDCDASEGGKTYDVPAIVDACEKLAEGVAATLTPEDRQEAQMMMEQYHLFDSEKALLGSALTSWKNAFTGQVSVVVDTAGAVPASMFGGSPVQSVPVPRVAINAGVADRSQIGAGSASFLQAVKQGIEKMGEDASALDDVPVSVSQSGEATLHMLALPVCCPGFSPTVAISDKTWSLSSSAALAEAWAKCELTPAAAEGKAVFAFTPAPLAGLFSDLAASDIPEAGKQDFAEAAEVAEEISSVISSVTGSLTTPGDGCLHLHVDVNMNKH